jgi:predicted nucleotidyltransferase component of viral defense system
LISRTELQEIALFKRLSLRNAERDYFLDLCLQTVSRHGQDLVFKGGTALYKLHNLNRFSVDLDFVSQRKRSDIDALTDEILRTARLLGINARSQEVEQYQRGINFTVAFNGPLYDGSKRSATSVAFNISLRERPQFVETLMYVPVYKELGSFELRVLRSDELLSEKVRAVMTREKPRDVYDVWFLLLGKGIKLDKDLVDRKLKIYGMRYDSEGFLKAAKRKRMMWVTDLKDLILGELPSFDKIIEEISASLI